MENKEHKLTPFISWLTLLYFVVLLAERAQSLIRIAAGSTGFFATSFDAYVNVITCISIAATLVLLAGFNKSFWRSLVSRSAEPDYQMLAITCGVALVGGMVHTEYTIAPVQFVSYGMLILAMVLRTVETAPAAGSKLKLWYSLAYLTVYSMSIPVMYHSYINLAVLFHVIAAVTALVLVACFTLMLGRVFTGKAENLLLTAPAALMVALDAAVIGLRWSEEVNSFALIFAILAAVMFAAGKLIFAAVKK